MSFEPQPSKGDPQHNTKAIVGLVLGIIGLVFIFIFPPIGLIPGIIGIFLSAKGLKSENKGIAIGGLVTSILGTLINGIFTALLAIGLALLGTMSNL
ncbi:hypothetical protein EDD58_10978 [Hazenella coriacea]|uniref:DUF4190 domain-containing protein n=2 Tax=Hazenella coriacea TaxID=1179467 RepID=A0A4R3L6H0_9BACL|nr:hypothetical protein EDD58_10978 [Hazenella coriacea]